jgi:hypothetical protein
VRQKPRQTWKCKRKGWWGKGNARFGPSGWQVPGIRLGRLLLLVGGGGDDDSGGAPRKGVELIGLKKGREGKGSYEERRRRGGERRNKKRGRRRRAADRVGCVVGSGLGTRKEEEGEKRTSSKTAGLANPAVEAKASSSSRPADEPSPAQLPSRRRAKTGAAVGKKKWRKGKAAPEADWPVGRRMAATAICLPPSSVDTRFFSIPSGGTQSMPLAAGWLVRCPRRRQSHLALSPAGRLDESSSRDRINSVAGP